MIASIGKSKWVNHCLYNGEYYFPIQNIEDAILSMVSEDWATNSQHGRLKQVQVVNKQRIKSC
jgi:hypothetical protein